MPTPNNIDDLNLTDLQRRFCEEYAVDWNGTRAARAAGYTGSDATLAATASRTLRIDKVQAYLDYLRENLAEACGISAQWIATHYKNQVLAGVEYVFADWFSKEEWEAIPAHVKACVKKIETKRDHYEDNDERVVSEWVKVEFYDKQTALKALRDMIGADAPKRTQNEHTGANGAPLINPNITVVAGPALANSEDGIDEDIAP